jgi:branched-chain amino acid transport system permease protein
MTSRVRNTSPLALLLLLTWVVVGAGGLAGGGLASLAMTATVYSVLVVGSYVFVGITGVISFGQPAFAAVGAYGAGILMVPVATKAMLLPDLPGPLANRQVGLAIGLVVAAGLGAGLGWLVAIPLMRLSGIAAGIATFAVLVICNNVATQWREVTGGAATLTGIPDHLTLQSALVIVSVILTAAFWYQNSRWGLWAKATREDETAARAAGINVERERRRAFTFSAAVMAVGGAMYGSHLGVLSPSSFYLDMTLLTLAMLVIGGMHSLLGALSGTFIVVGLEDVLRRMSDGVVIGAYQITLPSGTAQVVVALLMLVVILRAPEGVSRGRELAMPVRRSSRRRPAVNLPAPAEDTGA